MHLSQYVGPTNPEPLEPMLSPRACTYLAYACMPLQQWPNWQNMSESRCHKLQKIDRKLTDFCHFGQITVNSDIFVNFLSFWTIFYQFFVVYYTLIRTCFCQFDHCFLVVHIPLCMYICVLCMYAHATICPMHVHNGHMHACPCPYPPPKLVTMPLWSPIHGCHHLQVSHRIPTSCISGPPSFHLQFVMGGRVFDIWFLLSFFLGKNGGPTTSTPPPPCLLIHP